MINAIEEALKKYPKAKRTAVENATFDVVDGLEFRSNLALDRTLYKWSSDTVNAILYVVRQQTKAVAS